MSAGNQYAGEYDIKKCSIMSTKGIEFDIKSVIENISIFENIFTETISGIITINDTTDIVNNAPILGEEKPHFITMGFPPIFCVLPGRDGAADG